tara:strand:- start:24748 stop:25671 length:924 start_codon:yes stop_codon:yes gene_type:complete
MSFVIPCYNGEYFIDIVINSIKESLKESCDTYEIIMVDNGSIDESAKIAKRCGALVYESNSKTVSGVRNDGVKVARGKLLIFIDADVELDRSWYDVLSCKLKSTPHSKLITGSHCVVPENIRQPFFSWYKSIENDDRNTHLGSGHLIISRSLFEEIGGFDDSLKSGEDYDLCKRALQAGASVQADSELIARHLGYPNTVFEFIVRECWHGASDFSSVYYFIRSKVAMLAVIFALLQTGILIGVVAGSVTLVQNFATLTLVILAIFVYAKFGFQNIKYFLFNIIVAYIYLLGRASSVIYPLLERKRNE